MLKKKKEEEIEEGRRGGEGRRKEKMGPPNKLVNWEILNLELWH